MIVWSAVAALVLGGSVLNSAHAASEKPRAAADETIAKFTVRDGYEVTVAVDELDEARFMAFDDRGTLYVSRPQHGDVVALTDADADGVYEKRATFVSGKKLVHGLCWADGWLWFSQPNSIWRGRDADGDGQADEIVEVIPKGRIQGGAGGHWWRSLLVTGDAIYTSIGDSGNITDESRTERQKIYKFNLDGSGKAVFATGIRNNEKLRIRPGTTEIWGADHGSDWFGRELGEEGGAQPVTDFNPPCEFNQYVEGGFYGHPFIVGMRVPRYEYAKRADIVELAAKTIPPEWCFGAHWAPNGWTFLDPAKTRGGAGLPADHAGDVFVAFHGSWNRSSKVGYCVARVLFDNGHPYGLLKIVDLLGPSEKFYGRPVDCEQAADGSVLFSDDSAGRVYRIRGKAGK